jgi:hypothetical protein
MMKTWNMSMDDIYVGMNDLNFLWTLYYVCDELYVIVIVMDYVFVWMDYMWLWMDYMILCMKTEYKLKYVAIWEPEND